MIHLRACLFTLPVWFLLGPYIQDHPPRKFHTHEHQNTQNVYETLLDTENKRCQSAEADISPETV